MQEERTEKDGLGEKSLPAGVMWGIHTARALENFPLTGRPVNRQLIHAYGAVKLACAKTNHDDGKWDDASQFQTYLLTGGGNCGEWGILPTDLDGNCRVELPDFSEFAEVWLYCWEPTDAACDQSWRP